MLTENPVTTIVGDGRQERAYLKEVVTQAAQNGTSLFLGRFLTDMNVGEIAPRLSDSPWVVVRQYGSSYFVNARPPLAEALRAEQALEDAEAAIRSGKHQTVLLSQILNAVADDLLRPQDLAALVDARPGQVHLLMTGCGIPSHVVESLGLPKSLSLPFSPTY